MAGSEASAMEGMTESELVRACEEAIRERRRAERANDKLFNQIPCRDPSKGPNLREVLNYYGEKNKIFGELKARPKPASAFLAGCADNGTEDITDLPACYRPGSGFNLNEELAKNPGLIEELRRRAATNIGVHPSQLQSINHRPSRSAAAGGEAAGEDPRRCVAKLPDDIAHANMERHCQFCGHKGTRYRCSRCRLAFYCSAACQKRDWKASHSKSCRK
ncbi:hypothetical protein A3770_03p21230 [Chloropicon primus]|uniref:MYND-type domain-containing protein n=1 Tax=Chloropicon primus TaxID=1764295 RepID=A0A5B8MIW3_9CHLO|nr:hypothetical protein A3770_03p21230 [Chloropicon primus]|eukprot:QDZ19605.1 hypothetical protein A3770_03p21230 [Chloropicon primus]